MPAGRGPARAAAGVRVQVTAFGSHANGLCMHESDIDVVILNLAQPEDLKSGGAFPRSPAWMLRVPAP